MIKIRGLGKFIERRNSVPIHNCLWRHSSYFLTVSLSKVTEKRYTVQLAR